MKVFFLSENASNFYCVQRKNVKNRCDMNDELFGELHEQEEYGLFGQEHERQQCFLHSVSVSVCYNRDCFYYDKTDNTCVGNYKACTVKQTER